LAAIARHDPSFPKNSEAMRKHIPHPVTRLTSAHTELDILHGGDERSAIEESLVIARDLRDILKDGENILHVNTLVCSSRLEHAMGKRFDHGARRGRNHFVTYSADNFIHKLDVVRGIVLNKDIRYLILTGFELATLNSRHRQSFMSWIRAMRNEGVNIIIFTMSCPGNYGALGALRYSARTINEVGAYRNQDESSETINRIEQSETINSNEETESQHDSFADLPDVSHIYKGEPMPHPIETEPDHSDTELLKTKDLAMEMV
jgi:hypothetical protein